MRERKKESYRKKDKRGNLGIREKRGIEKGRGERGRGGRGCEGEERYKAEKIKRGRENDQITQWGEREKKKNPRIGRRMKYR